MTDMVGDLVVVRLLQSHATTAQITRIGLAVLKKMWLVI
jgi:hypothetical protein